MQEGAEDKRGVGQDHDLLAAQVVGEDAACGGDEEGEEGRGGGDEGLVEGRQGVAERAVDRDQRG